MTQVIKFFYFGVSLEIFEKFLLESPVVAQCVSSLRESAQLEINTGNEKQYFCKKNSKICLEKIGENPDMTFTTQVQVLNQIFADPNLSIGAYGVKIIESIVKKEIKTQVHIGPIKFFSHGYLGILAQGGKEFLTYLTQKNISLKDIGKILKKFKNS